MKIEFTTDDNIPKAVKTLIRAIFASIPGLASIGQIWSEYEDEGIHKSIEDFTIAIYDELENIIDDIEKIKIDVQLLREIIEKVSYEDSIEKIRYYSKLFIKSALMKYDADKFFHYYFVFLIKSLRQEHYLILRILKKDESIRYEDVISKFEAEYPDFPREIPATILNQLENYGLIYKYYGQNFWSTYNIYQESDWQINLRNTKYELSKTAIKFIEYVLEN